MRAEALSRGEGRVHERCACRDGALERDRRGLRRSRWRKEVERRGPNRVIPGTRFEKGDDRVALDELRKDFTTGGMKVMGEIGLQYGGTSLSDPSVDKYFALAEEFPWQSTWAPGVLDAPIFLCPRFRGSA